MADIFISYKREDREWAQALSAALEAQGWTTWWDTRLAAGEYFDVKIEEQLDAAKCVIVLWSKQSVKSRWVVAEAGEALEREILVPVFIEEARPPLIFRRIHTARLIGWNKNTSEPEFIGLVADVSRILGPVPLSQEQSKSNSEDYTRKDNPREGQRGGKNKKEIASQGIDFVLIPEGSYMMGSNDGYDDEKPVHQVKISRPFYLGKYPVTQAQWQTVMGNNPSHFKGASRPVEQVSWNEVQEFITKLNELEGCEGCYRLPTEAEWEYAARAGTTTAYSFGDDVGQLGNYAWYGDNSNGETHSVGEKGANLWGLYDMHGNVWEWVQDWYGNYPEGPLTDPTGPESGSYRVVRGGSWGSTAGACGPLIVPGSFPRFASATSGFV